MKKFFVLIPVLFAICSTGLFAQEVWIEKKVSKYDFEIVGKSRF